MATLLPRPCHATHDSASYSPVLCFSTQELFWYDHKSIRIDSTCDSWYGRLIAGISGPSRRILSQLIPVKGPVALLDNGRGAEFDWHPVGSKFMAVELSVFRSHVGFSEHRVPYMKSTGESSFTLWSTLT